MTGNWRFVFAASAMAALLALGACGRSFVTSGERASWRHQAEVTCIQSGAVKTGAAVVQIEPIEGPGMCGADFPFKVAALGSSAAMSYGDEVRPPGSIRNPLNEPRYGAPAQAQPVLTKPVQGETLRWTPGPSGTDARQGAPAGPPVSLSPPGFRPAPEADDIPDDAILPKDRASAPRTQPAYMPPSSNARRAPNPDDNDDDPASQRSATPSFGPATTPSLGRGTRMATASMPAALTPAATLACPLVSALDKWVAEGVQPAAQKWFGSQVATIKQISAYSCRGMVGAGISHVSEHAFGNALDVAGFVLADGRKISVQEGWRGSPEEQGFLHDVQLAACDTFTTVLAPGYNAAHYNHIHVDLMRRASGRRPCRPDAIPGDVAAAKARSMFAGKRGRGDYTGSIGGKDDAKLATIGAISQRDRNALSVIAGEDGEFDEDEELTTSSITPRSPASLSTPLPTLVPSKMSRPGVFRDVPP